MHVKLSMKRLARDQLSEHELKRCRAEARGSAWGVWEEDILWWSMDREHWSPVDESLWPRKKRWLVVESEEGVYPALLWDVTDDAQIPRIARAPQSEAPRLTEAFDFN